MRAQYAWYFSMQILSLASEEPPAPAARIAFLSIAFQDSAAVAASNIRLPPHIFVKQTGGSCFLSFSHSRMRAGVSSMESGGMAGGIVRFGGAHGLGVGSAERDSAAAVRMHSVSSPSCPGSIVNASYLERTVESGGIVVLMFDASRTKLGDNAGNDL